ncbi:rhodanese-like domain-containing protein [Halanaerocella petrolearia]
MVFGLFSSSVENISPEDLEKELAKGKELKVVDVRYDYEYDEGHIPESINIPYPELKNNLDKLSKEEEIAVICTAGVRSKKATKKLMKEGYENVRNVTGGMRAWEGKQV